MLKLLLFCLLLVTCWPIAIAALLLYPLIWLLLLPFRLVGIVVGGGLRADRCALLASGESGPRDLMPLRRTGLFFPQRLGRILKRGSSSGNRYC